MPVPCSDVDDYWQRILHAWFAYADNVRPKLNARKLRVLAFEAQRRMYAHAPYRDEPAELRAVAFSVFDGMHLVRGSKHDP